MRTNLGEKFSLVSSSCKYDLWLLSYLFSQSWHFHICFLHIYSFFDLIFILSHVLFSHWDLFFFNLPSKFKLHFSFSTCSTFTSRFKFLFDTLVLNNVTLGTRIFKKDLNSFTIFVGSEDILEKKWKI